MLKIIAYKIHITKLSFNILLGNFKIVNKKYSEFVFSTNLHFMATQRNLVLFVSGFYYKVISVMALLHY